MENINSYVCIENELPETIITRIEWTDSQNKFQADPKRIQIEIDQTLEQVSKQIKQGIIKKKPPMEVKLVTIKDNQNLKDIIGYTTVPMVTKLAGHELFGQMCQCGCKENLIECPDCLKRLIKK